MSVVTAAEVTQFWVETVGPEKWYATDGALDEEVAARFGPTWRAGQAGALDHWILRPDTALALVIVLDQFPRNMFRGGDTAFSTDRKALCAAKKALSFGHDLRIGEPERQFFYLPLMHSECLTDQERCVRLIMTRMPKMGAPNLDAARDHREVIRKFGRFPYRNDALGRVSSALEQIFLEGRGQAA